MNQFISMVGGQRNAIRLAAGGVVAASILSLGALPAEAANLRDIESQLKAIEARVATMQPQVLGVATGTPRERIAPVRPTCRVNYDKKVYNVGDTVKISYNTVGVEGMTVQLTGDLESADVPNGSVDMSSQPAHIKSSGIITATAKAAGAVGITMSVTSKTGHTGVCGRMIGVIDQTKNQNPVYARISTQIQNVMKQEARLVEALRKAEESLARVRAELDSLNIKLSEVPQIKTKKATTTASTTARFRLDDVQGVEKVENTAGNDRYTITLTTSDTVIVTVPVGASNSVRNKAFSDAGYRGSVPELLKKLTAVVTS